MPFDGIADPVAAKSLQALDLMEDRLEGGRKWTRHFMFRDGGKMCLLGASYFGCNIGAGSRVTGRWNILRGRSRRSRAPRTGATAAGSRRPSRTSTIAARAIAKSSAFCAARKSWPAPTFTVMSGQVRDQCALSDIYPAVRMAQTICRGSRVNCSIKPPSEHSTDRQVDAIDALPPCCSVHVALLRRGVAWLSNLDRGPGAWLSRGGRPGSTRRFRPREDKQRTPE